MIAPALKWAAIAAGGIVLLGAGAASASSSPGAPNFPEPMPTIKLGSSGPAVSTWQGVVGVPQSGSFDAATDAATRAYQSSKGLTADGIVGPKTWESAGFVGIVKAKVNTGSPSAPAPPQSTPSPNVPIATAPAPPGDPFGLPEDIASREKIILDHVAAGRAQFDWTPISLTNAAGNVAQVQVMRRALALETNGQRLIVSLSFNAAHGAAMLLGARMLTSRIADQIYRVADARLTPITRPWSQDGTMARTSRMREQSASIEKAVASVGAISQALIANEGKHWVLTKRNWSDPDPIRRPRGANFGWHGVGSSRSPGGLQVIQSIGLAHDRTHADYSQLVVLVRPDVVVDGRMTTYAEVLADPALSSLLSDEGPLPGDVHPALAGVA